MTTWHQHRRTFPERPVDGTAHPWRSIILTLVVLVLVASVAGFLVGEGLAVVVRLALGFFDTAG